VTYHSLSVFKTCLRWSNSIQSSCDPINPIPFSKDIDDPDYEESWSDGLIMFHNPNARHPVNPEAFSDISHIFYSETEGFHGFHQPYDVLGSITLVLTEKSE
jgi:hypothetical protein